MDVCEVLVLVFWGDDFLFLFMDVQVQIKTGVVCEFFFPICHEYLRRAFVPILSLLFLCDMMQDFYLTIVTGELQLKTVLTFS